MAFNESSDCNQPSGYVASMHCNKNKHVTADCATANFVHSDAAGNFMIPKFAFVII